VPRLSSSGLRIKWRYSRTKTYLQPIEDYVISTEALDAIVSPQDVVPTVKVDSPNPSDLLTSLRLALGSQGIPEVYKAYQKLSERGHEDIIMGRDWELISTRLNRYISKLPTAKVDSNLMSLALRAAARREVEGLRALVQLCFDEGDYQGVITWYENLLALQEQLGTSFIPDADTQQEQQPSISVATDPDSNRFEEPIDFEDPETNQKPHGMSDIVLTTIAAYAAQDRFNEAFDMFLNTPTWVRLDYWRVKSFARNHLSHSPELLEKLQQWVGGLVTCRLVSRTALFFDYLMGYANDHEAKAIERYHKRILGECRRENGLFRISPNGQIVNENPTERRCVYVTHILANNFLRVFSRCRRMDLAENFWKDVVQLGLKPNIQMWTTLIDGYGRNGQLQEAEETWKRLIDEDLEPDSHTYSAMMHAYFAARKPSEGSAMFEQYLRVMRSTPGGEKKLREEEILPLYNAVIHGYFSHGKTAKANAILQDIIANGPKPDVVTYNILLRHYGRIGDMQNLAKVLRSFKLAGLEPDMYSFSTLLSALYQLGKNDAHTKLLKTMETMGIKPTVAIYSSIINFLVRQPGTENLRNAMLLLQQMEKEPDENVRPNAITYTSFLAGIFRNPSVPEHAAKMYANELFSRMRLKGIPANSATYHYLIKACLQNPEAHSLMQALNFYREMQKRGLRITNRTRYVLLHGLLGRKYYVVAKNLVGEMEQSGVKMDESLNKLIYRIQRAEWKEYLRGR